MKPLFPIYIIKKQAKGAMSGRFWKSFAVVILPALIVAVVSAIVIGLTPGAVDSIGLIARGSFESYQARLEYMDNVINNYVITVMSFTVLFSFLMVGSARACIDMVRGKDVKIKTVFSYYNKWYITSIYPALSAFLPYIIGKGLNMLVASGTPVSVAMFVVNLVDIFFLVISFKFMFLDYILADTDCKSFIQAAKTSWNMVGFNTAINVVILVFSFIGWYLLSAFTGGLLLIYTLPYLSLSMAALYEANVIYNKQKTETE